MRLLRALVVGGFTAAAVLVSPPATAAESGIAPQDCERVWIWWIPFPCQPD
ncbi:hypothetical protein ACI789_24115 [Geodermatophilus sp. SYSU D00965]